MTPEEKRLWYHFLKDLNCNVKRQKVIHQYIVDFYIPSKSIIIEIDGEQHFLEDGKKKDAIRDQNLYSLGYTVLRYSNNDIRFHFAEVCEDILNQLNSLRK